MVVAANVVVAVAWVVVILPVVLETSVVELVHEPLVPFWTCGWPGRTSCGWGR